MITRRALEKQIRTLEGFDVHITLADGRAVPTARRFQPYVGLFKKGAKQSWTVQEWKGKKFYPSYEGLEVSVLRGDGSQAVGQTVLRTVRESYYE